MSTLPGAPDFRVDGKRALVTGASRGLGLATAAALAQAGVAVMLAARSEPELREACEQIGAAGGQCNFLVLDVTDPAAVDREIGARGPFQILVNNAGMSRPKELVALADEDIDAVLNLNVKAAFYVTARWSGAFRAAGWQARSSTCLLRWGMSPARAEACTARANTRSRA